MIIQVRGGSGAGKSWVVRELLRLEGFTQPEPLVYETPLCFIVGRFDVDGPVPKKGGEAAGDGKKLEALLTRLVAAGKPVVVETSKSPLSRDALLRLTPVIWATLDTPAAERIRRIYERRELSGINVGKDLKEDFHRQHGRASITGAKTPPPGVVGSYWLRHQDPLPDLLALVKGAR